MIGKRLPALLAVLIALLSCAFQACAEIPCRCPNPPDKCTCFIQLGDKGLAVKQIIKELKKQGYLDKSANKGVFSPEVRQAVIQLQTDYNLKCTGWMDDETLNALLRDVLPNESEKHTARFWDGIYYVPTDGGIRFHSDPECCGMENPRMISGINAVCLGLKHCGWDSYIECDPLTYTSLGLTPRELPDSYYAEEKETVTASVPSRSLSTDETGSIYIGNKNSHVFHYPNCKSVKKMSEKNKVELSSREEAIAEGYRPCGNCNP